jgi:hypothetical protein
VSVARRTVLALLPEKGSSPWSRPRKFFQGEHTLRPPARSARPDAPSPPSTATRVRPDRRPGRWAFGAALDPLVANLRRVAAGERLVDPLHVANGMYNVDGRLPALHFRDDALRLHPAREADRGRRRRVRPGNRISIFVHPRWLHVSGGRAPVPSYARSPTLPGHNPTSSAGEPPFHAFGLQDTVALARGGSSSRPLRTSS